MATLSDDDLVLHFYEEHPDPAEVERALASDPTLKQHYESLALDLKALAALDAPEPRPGLEGRMWARIEPELTRKRRFGFLTLSSPRWGFVAAAAAALVCAFLAGRYVRPTPSEEETKVALKALAPEARDRVLAAAVADHLDSSERLLMEVSNGAPESPEQERRFAEALLGENRLYRKAAERAGQRRIAAVLAEIEPLLEQLAQAPSAPDLRMLRERMNNRDLLFKVRVTRANLKETS